MSRSWVPRRQLRLRDFLFLRGADAGIDEELEFHIAARAEQLATAEGLTADAARAEALRRFGDPRAWRRRCAEVDRRRMRREKMKVRLGSIAQDARFAFRTAANNPSFTAVVVLILALGIGGTTALFSVLDGVLLRALPYYEPDRIVQVAHLPPEGGWQNSWGAFSPQDFEDLKRESTALRDLSAFYVSSRNLIGDGPPAQLSVATVSEDFFRLLGQGAIAGRAFDSADLAEGEDRLVVLGHRLWMSRYGGDESIVGRTVNMDGDPMTVVGVMPPDFRLPSPEVDVWIPISRITDAHIPHVRGLRWMEVVGRLAPSATRETAARETAEILARLAGEYPDSNEGWDRAELVPLQDVLVADVRPALVLLFVATGLVLLIACANVANLMLVRMTAREREMGIRVAIGASSGRLVRQTLVESLVLALVGGAAGLGLAAVAVRVLTALSAGTIPRVEEIGLDARVAAFAVIAAVGTGLLFGLAPALGAARSRPGDVLHGGRGAAIGGGRRLRNALVVGEVALAAALVVGAGLMLKSFWTLLHIDPGIERDRILVVDLQIPDDRKENYLAYHAALFAAIEAVPGVTAVGASEEAPLAAAGEPYGFERRDVAGPPLEAHPVAGVQIVTPGYFETLGIPVLRGRSFTASDPETALIVNRALADQVWQADDPVGRELYLGDTPFRVVGVVENVRHEGLTAGTPSGAYVLSAGFRRSKFTIYVRTTLAPMTLAEEVREAIWAVNPNQPIGSVQAMKAHVGAQVAQPRFFTLLVLLFAGTAVALAALGIYGVISYFVGRRTAEIGVRLALGATGRDVIGLVLRRALVVAVAGLLVGLATALWLSRLLAGLLYEVSPQDPAVFVAVGSLLLLTAIAAALAPAVRAARLDPHQALRTE